MYSKSNSIQFNEDILCQSCVYLKKCKMNPCPQEAYNYTNNYNTKEIL